MRKTLTVIATVCLFGGLLAVGASADEFDADPDSVAVDLDVGPVTSDVAITLVAVNEPPPHQGCNLQDNSGPNAHFVDGTATSSDTSVATALWADSGTDTQRFNDCGETYDLTITAVGCGTATVTIEATAFRAPGGPIGQPNAATFSDAVITVTVTGDNCDGGGGEVTVCAQPAAPAWANAILQAYNSSVTKSQQVKAKDYGAAVSAVAQHMEQGATFDGVAKSMQDDYADAVWQFLQTHTGKTLPHPDAGVARPGWACTVV